MGRLRPPLAVPGGFSTGTAVKNLPALAGAVSSGPVVLTASLMGHGRASQLRERNRGGDEGSCNRRMFSRPYLGQAGAVRLDTRASLGKFPALPRGVRSALGAVDHGVL